MAVETVLTLGGAEKQSKQRRLQLPKRAQQIVRFDDISAPVAVVGVNVFTRYFYPPAGMSDQPAFAPVSEALRGTMQNAVMQFCGPESCRRGMIGRGCGTLNTLPPFTKAKLQGGAGLKP